MFSQKLQKLTSLFLIFFLLFSITLRVPVELFLGYSAYAAEKEFYNLVSIVVDEESYDELRTKLVRYSRDIQSNLENTRVVILPTPSDASALDIASLNESLYFEGYKAHKDVDFESRLIGTVLVGKVPVPVVFQDGNSAKSILPYVDFEEKSFIYNHEIGKYEKNEDAQTSLSPEIWHGVISANTGDRDDDIQAMKDYFDKNHDFYTGAGVFDESKGVIDGTDSKAPDTYEPYVFYYDQFRENAALQYQNYIGYQMYLQNLEDITYNRYSKDLAEKVKDQVLGIQNADITDLLTQIDPEFDVSSLSSGPDISGSSDIISRYVTDNATKKFLQIFNGTTLGEMRKHVHNAGRYNDGGSRVQMNMPPFIISVLDQVSAEVVKNVNDSLERDITNIVTGGLARDIAIPVQNTSAGSGPGGTPTCRGVNTFFFYGTPAANITNASQCSIYKGESLSGTLVEANRGYNIDNVSGDTQLCGLGMRYSTFTGTGGEIYGELEGGVEGFWGGNSPANFDSNSGNFDTMQLGPHNLKGGIRPVFDILGSKEINNNSKVPSPVDCFQDGVYIETYRQHVETRSGGGDDGDTQTCVLDFSLPINEGDPLVYNLNASRGSTHESRFCQRVNTTTTPSESFDTIYNGAWGTTGFGGNSCVIKELILNGAVEKTQTLLRSCGGPDDSCTPCPAKNVINYNIISSHILHTSPTDGEFGAQTSSLFTPSLPVDKNRYIDFIGANGQGADFGYRRIDFPALFRVTSDNPADLSLESIAEKLEEHLDDVSAQINGVIRNSDPSGLSGTQLDMYNLLKTGDFPAANVDLHQTLADKPLEVFTIDGESKEISYLDTLVFAIYWNNLKTVSSKYKFVFENYLSNQFTGNDYKFHLPESKKSYEAGYFAAPGDSANMYVKLDPELKGTHPYAAILASNLNLNGVLTASSVANPTSSQGTFECAPPDGVNIFRWIPAVICWLKNMLPPTIKIGEGECGASLLSDEEKEEILACQQDTNKNGINDCIEDTLAEGYLVLKSNARRYFYNTPGILQTEIYTKDDELYRLDSMSYVNTRLTKVEIPRDSSEVFSGDNIEVIYDVNTPALSTPEARKIAEKYINFTDISVRANRGITQTYFYGKGSDVNAYFESTIQTRDVDGEIVVDLQSNEQRVEVRGDRIFVNTYVVEDDGTYFYDNSIGVSSSENLCVIDGGSASIEGAAASVVGISDASEKLLLSLQNSSPAGNALPINYPVSLELVHENETVFSQTNIAESELQSVYPIFAAQKSGRYSLNVEDSTGFKSSRNIDVLPDVAVKINPIISTNIVEVGGNISTHLFTILDQYDNAASGEIYSVDVSIDGDGLVFDGNGQSEMTYNIVDGYKAIRLRSTNDSDTNTLRFTLKNLSGDTIDTKSATIRTIDDIRLSVSELDGTPKVGGRVYKYKLEFSDASGTKLTGLNSRAYMGIHRLYGTPEDVYVEIEDGEAEISFKTSTLAGKDIPVEFQLEGGNEIYTHYIDILPDVAIKINLSLNRDKIEANPGDSAVLEAVLKDRYNNDVFNDSTTRLDFEIHNESNAYISVDAGNKTVSDGKAKFKISGTDIPGIGYFKVSADPDLSGNSFSLEGQAPFDRARLTVPTMQSGGELTDTGKKFFKVYSSSKYISKFITESHLTGSEDYKALPNVLKDQVRDFWNETNSLEVFGIGENAGSIETFFFWDKKDIEDNSYNTLYSVLLGAPYGDISKQDYLAGALLFDRDNSALAVTSLLNSPYKFHDILSLEENGHVDVLRGGDITQDIEVDPSFDSDNRLVLDFNNAALDTYLGRAYYNIDENSTIDVSIISSEGYNFVSVGDDARIEDETGKTIFEIYENGRFVRKAGTSVVFDYEYSQTGVRFILKDGSESVAHITVSGDFDINITRDETLLTNKLGTLENTIILHLKSNSYSTRDIYKDAENSFKKVYYHDPFADNEALDDFHNNDIVGFESVLEESGIGWQDSNTPLLSFAAGDGVGEATKHFQSFSMINLGDPVASLKPVKNTFRGTDNEKSFDPTLGSLITGKDTLIGYQTFDYNNDDRQDLLTIHTDGYIDLYENKNVEGRFVKHSSLVYAVDGGSVRMVKTGDITGDGYGDIFFVTEDGEPVLFNNVEKDFNRINLSEQMSLSGAIIQAEVFDMDNDGNDDIVTLDDAGEIHIFYGNGPADAPVLTKNFIGDGYAITLSEEVVSHGGAIYFEGLAQVNPDDLSNLLAEAQSYNAEVANVVSSTVGGEYDPNDTIPTPEFIDDSLVSSFLYIALPYIPTDVDLDDREQSEILLDELENDLSNIGGSPQGEALAEETTGALDEFIQSYDEYVTYSGYRNAYNTQTFFLRSQYADLENVEVTKVFRDTTLPHLQTGDIVHMDITLKNTGSSRINNVAYVDNIPKYFNFVDNEFTVLTEDNRVISRKQGIADYNVIIDGFYLDPGEETTIRILLETLPLSYGHMQVGLFEQGEVGDDVYGDIILKENEKNCGREADIYRSITSRTYSEGKTTPTCNESDIDIGNTFSDLVDDDGNGIPDYIDNLLETDSNGNLVPTSNSGALNNYIDDVRDDFAHDSDGDGIPDRDDSMDSTSGAADFMGALDQINGAIDDIASEIDQLIEGLSCGFGGGSCFANPLNWAPLAPGNDPTLFGMPIGDGLRVNEGIPMFSALTGRQTSCGKSPCCLPSVYPATSQAYVPGPFCGPSSAGGSRGVWSSTNFVRVFATPTLTGGFGIAVCFGGPALAAGNANPIGAHPVVPGGNCIVAAQPLFGCEGGEGNPGVLGYPEWGDFGIIHANCDGTGGKLFTPAELESSFVQDYLEYLRSGIRPPGMYNKYVQAMQKVSDNPANFTLPSEPLINIGSGESGLMSSSVDIDVSALGSGNFQDVIQVKNKRIGAFPNFLMDWVERQLDEITSKLTNLPKIYVILPEFGGIFDYGWEGFSDNMRASFEQGRAENQAERETRANNVGALQAQRAGLDCSGNDALRCRTLDLQIAGASGRNTVGRANETLSGIKEVYEFVGNIPLVNIETETIHVNVPWIETTEIDRFLADWKYSLEEYKQELTRAKDAWSFGAACSGTDAEVARCQQENDVRNNAVIQAEDFIASFERNIQILEEYKEFPEKLAKLINIKEVWLEQILCNIEAISSLMGGWINDNGERFKAWVELYMLIKAALKSWQLFIDVFLGYEEECHECKNERQDLQNFLFRLISAVIPSPPIIQFPKWPDIILDFHNIRAGMTIYMPDFEMNLRPIVLPDAPILNLPATPTVNFRLPELPTLPQFTIPELPELPSLPTVELPDLPPPPKIPKLFGAVEAVLNIVKLVTKVMCILKQSPFVPEWRAGDQIAFLTERNGYLPTDFIDIQPPAFSYSAISAIKVTTYVNFEFEMDFIIEAVRSITAPLDEVTNNISNMFQIQISDINVGEDLPTQINGGIELDGEVNFEDVSFVPLNENPEGIYMVAGMLAGAFMEFTNYLAAHNTETLSNKEFISYVSQELASDVVVNDPKTRELQAVWNEVMNLTYSKEDKFIEEIRENNRAKFETLENIISTEIEYSRQQKQALKNMSSPEFIELVSEEKDGRIDGYNALMEEHNLRTLDAAINLVSGPSEQQQALEDDLKDGADDLMKTVRGGLQAYKDTATPVARYNVLADHAPGHTGPAPAGGALTCSATGQPYQYTYEGIYVLENGRNYKLFDYTDLLRGDEKAHMVDVDGDDDTDVLYMMDKKLYFKENRSNTPVTSHLSTPPLILNIADNKFYNGETYYEAVNGFSEAHVSDGSVNIEFKKPTNPLLKNFRMVYHTIVDRYLHLSSDYEPEEVETHVVDALDISDAATLETDGEGYEIHKNIATLGYVGAMNDLKLTTEKLENIRGRLSDNTVVALTSGAKIYAGNTSFSIEYTQGNESNELTIPARSYAQFDTVIEITGVSGDGYVSMGILEDVYGTDVIDYIGRPLSLGTKIKYTGNTSVLNSSSHVDIRYYDGSELALDMRDVRSYTLYDLGNVLADDYKIRLDVPNDFYYARIHAFNGDINSTWSKQILLSPQTEGDIYPPELGLNQKIRIPVYQQQRVDLTPYIYEDGGLSGIAEVKVDFDLNTDLDADGNPKNDADTDKIQIHTSAIKIEVEFGPYDELFEKDISIALIDNNGNIGQKKVAFEVYTPAPEINAIESGVVEGQIDESLLDEPVRLYRYRGGVIEKLQKSDGTDLVETDESGGYAFETTSTASGLTLSHSGTTIARIDEYTGQINLETALAQIDVVATNDESNESIYPEIRILFAGNPIFRQFIRMPEGPVLPINDLSEIDTLGIYMRLLDQDNYNLSRVPLGVPVNPGSASIYRNGDDSFTPLMTVFNDGRINVDIPAYDMIFRNQGEKGSLILIDTASGNEVAQVIFNLEASYILR